MKLSISLADAQVAFLDEFARRRDCTRSAAVHEAVNALRTRTLADDYEGAWDEWGATQDSESWEQASADGL